ncbi:MAG: uroporphyrinogen decarboxylase family protein [Candidatus Humimicrobiaceae bacterium]
MKPRERLIVALKKGIPDQVPIFEFLFSPKLQEKFLGYRTELYDGAAIVKCATRLGLDGTFIPIGGYCGFEESHTEGKTFTDEWGVTYVKSGWPVMVQIENPIKNRQDWERYSMPNPKAPHRIQKLKDAVDANEGEIAICAGILGPVTFIYWYLMNIYTFSYILNDDPGLFVDITDAYTEFCIEAAKEVVKLGGVDAFILADDWGANNSLLVSPKHLRQHFLKPFANIVKGLKKFGLPVIMHNDGRLWEIMDDLVNTGIDGYHPVEKSAGMDLGIIKNKYKGKLCPVGNVDNKSIMVSGTPEDVVLETINCLKIGAPDGGYVISTDHSLHDDIPEENVWTFIETVKEYGKYPLRFNS